MKKHLLHHAFLILLTALLMGTGQLAWGMCGTTVTWHNLSGEFNPCITSDVIDQNIDVIGVNALVEGIHVEAQTCDVLITVTNSDSVITGCANGQVEPPRLYLFANTGRTITFQLDWDLTFRGTAQDSTLIDLMVTVSGPGQVIFNLDGSGFQRQVLFTSEPGTGGAKLFVARDSSGVPTLIFQRTDPDSMVNQNVKVVVGSRSCISYISDGTVSDSSVICFDAANNTSGTGCTILCIQNGGAVIIWEHLLNASLNSEFLLTDILFDQLVNNVNPVVFKIQNGQGSGYFGALQVINDNDIWTGLMIDPFCDGAFTGSQLGFILGPNGQVLVNNLSYLDYIGTRTNTVPTVNTPFDNLQPEVQNKIECMQITGPQALIKERNASAFIVDGTTDPNVDPALISLLGQSAIYFRSGVDCNGEVVASFTVNPGQLSEGAGNIVFDVEGLLNVQGSSNNNTGLSVLSLQVTKTGCPVNVETNPQNLVFPARTFARIGGPNSDYLVYNKGAWLINNRMNMFDTSIIHTDQNHDVFERNTLGHRNTTSEPTYIGGETFKLCAGVTDRPLIAFYDSILRVHKNIGSTGVDWRVPNNTQDDNVSILRFYYNGRLLDDGYGRVMVLGTNVGSTSACGQLIDQDSHLDVFQDVDQANATIHQLCLDVNANTTCIMEGITGDIFNQCDVHSIFLNNASNISIGDNENGFALVTTPSLLIKGDFFSFETAGGLWAYPEAGGTTGQGAMFVDQNGIVSIQGGRRASMGMMAVRSGNGIINLPKSQVFFDPRVGITKWNINLIDPSQRTLIPAGECLSDFTMDWGAVTKDYVSSDSFVPYEPKIVPGICDCAPVTDSNLRALPMVQGQVAQFQVKRSRIGDQAHLQVKGGIIKELVFLVGCNAGEAPVGFIVVEDEGFVGLSTAHRNVDSLFASIKLGINGVILCANGNGTFELNEDILIDNVCHILTGTSFGVGGPNTLTIHSLDQKELRIKSTGVLDLSSFDDDNKILQFAGNVNLVCEPGARIILGGGVLQFTDAAKWTFERVLNPDLLVGTQPRDLDPIRVKLIGRGNIVMNEGAQMFLLEDQFFGIETDPQCESNTSFTWALNNQAQIHIGTSEEPGGSFQIGNVRCEEDATISVSFVLDGIGVVFEINRQGFLGIGVGMADKLSAIPNQWLVNCLSNVASVVFDIRQGTFKHNRIVTGDDSTAALIAIGPGESYTWNFDTVIARILGGGNLVLLGNCTDEQCDEVVKNKTNWDRLASETRLMIIQALDMMERAESMMKEAKAIMFTRGPRTPEKAAQVRSMMRQGRDMKKRARQAVRNVITPSLNPTVQSTDECSQDGRLCTSIMSGKYLLIDLNKGAQPSGVSPATLYAYLKTDTYPDGTTPTQNAPRANIKQNVVSLGTLGFVDGTEIRRDDIQLIIGPDGIQTSDISYSTQETGAVGIKLNSITRAITNVTELQGTN